MAWRPLDSYFGGNAVVDLLLMGPLAAWKKTEQEVTRPLFYHTVSLLVRTEQSQDSRSVITPMTIQITDRELAEVLGAIHSGDQNRAADFAIAAWKRGLEHPLILLLVAERLESEGFAHRALEMVERAVGSLEKATLEVRDEAELWRRCGDMLARQGMLADAVEAFDVALDIDPHIYLALIAAGAASYQMGNMQAAHDYYRRAADLKPDEAELLSTLSLIAAHRKVFQEARSLAERALLLHGASITAHLALARADLLEGFAYLAEERLTQLFGRPDLDDRNRISILDLRAEARDALDRPAEAFTDYEGRNKILERLNSPTVSRELRERRVDQASRLAGYFAAANSEQWRAGAGEDIEGARTARGHVFLLGFPRSGTNSSRKSIEQPSGSCNPRRDRSLDGRSRPVFQHQRRVGRSGDFGKRCGRRVPPGLLGGCTPDIGQGLLRQHCGRQIAASHHGASGHRQVVPARKDPFRLA